MARRRDEEILEPILPKHPPYQREDGSEGVAGGDGDPAVGPDRGDRGDRPSWDRLVLVGCAVVAALSLVVLAMRASSIAEDQRIQTCQIRVYAQEQATGTFGGRGAQERIAQDLAECIGDDPSGGAEDDNTD